MADVIKNRSEILFLYDITDANPNGDPNDENKPRIDEETGINIVTDVRLKRTIRDYLYEYKKQEIFIRVRDKNGKLKDKDDLLADSKGKNRLKECIDLRLFGETTAVEEQRKTRTGPVQFKYGRSLHKVNLTYIKGTTVMPSKKGKEQGTFTERYILPYSLIAFYGVINETAAITQEIPLTEDDIDLMMEALWHGTKNLISGSKFGQNPRFLLQVIYKEGLSFYIGELDKRIRLISDKRDEEIRRIEEVNLDITQLIDTLSQQQEKIHRIRMKVDEHLNCVKDDKSVDIAQKLKELKLPVEKFNF